MQVILKEEKKGRGNMGDEITVADGYARNYLIPKNIAVEATPANRISFKNEMGQKRRKLEKLKKEFAGIAEKIGMLTLPFTRKAGEGGKLFGSVTSQDVADKLKEMGFDVDKRKIDIKETIKKTGSYAAIANLHHEVTANVIIEVKAEEAEVKATEEEAEVKATEEEVEVKATEEEVKATEEEERPEEETPAE